MHCLVVCGATEADSVEDSLGLSMALHYLHADASGTFLSCFPLNERLEILGQQTPPIEDTEFGAERDGKHYSHTGRANASHRKISGTLIAAASN